MSVSGARGEWPERAKGEKPKNRVVALLIPGAFSTAIQTYSEMALERLVIEDKNLDITYIEPVMASTPKSWFKKLKKIVKNKQGLYKLVIAAKSLGAYKLYKKFLPDNEDYLMEFKEIYLITVDTHFGGDYHPEKPKYTLEFSSNLTFDDSKNYYQRKHYPKGYMISSVSNVEVTSGVKHTEMSKEVHEKFKGFYKVFQGIKSIIIF